MVNFKNALINSLKKKIVLNIKNGWGVVEFLEYFWHQLMVTQYQARAMRFFHYLAQLDNVNFTMSHI